MEINGKLVCDYCGKQLNQKKACFARTITYSECSYVEIGKRSVEIDDGEYCNAECFCNNIKDKLCETYAKITVSSEEFNAAPREVRCIQHRQLIGKKVVIMPTTTHEDIRVRKFFKK